MDNIHIKEYFEKIIDLRFNSAERELYESKKELERRLAGLNELREEVTKDRTEFVKRDLYDTKIEAYDKLINTIEKRITIIETRSITWSAAIVIFFIIAQILLNLLNI